MNAGTNQDNRECIANVSKLRLGTQVIAIVECNCAPRRCIFKGNGLDMLRNRSLNALRIELRLLGAQAIHVFTSTKDRNIAPLGIVCARLIGNQVGRETLLHHQRQQFGRITLKADRWRFSIVPCHNSQPNRFVECTV